MLTRKNVMNWVVDHLQDKREVEDDHGRMVEVNTVAAPTGDLARVLVVDGSPRLFEIHIYERPI